MKATNAAQCQRLEQIPNVGPAIAADLRLIGIVTPAALSKRDPYAMYRKLCLSTGQRHDPCVIDTFISAVRFMQGQAPRPWWHYTAERKRHLAGLDAPSTEPMQSTASAAHPVL